MKVLVTGSAGHLGEALVRTLLDLQQRGVQFADLALDGSQVMLSAIREVQLTCPLRPDLFHLYQTGRQIRAKLNWRAELAEKKVQQVQHAAQAAQPGHRRVGRPYATPPNLSLAEAQSQTTAAREQHALWTWLFAELRQTLHWTQSKAMADKITAFLATNLARPQR